MESEKQIKVFSIIWCIVAILIFIAWPLSHWLYYGIYTQFLGVPQETYQDSLIKMIGTCGVLLSMCLLVISKEPRKSELLVKMVSVFLVLLSITFIYLAFFSDFSKVELVNVGAFLLIAVMLPMSYKWINKK